MTRRGIATALALALTPLAAANAHLMPAHTGTIVVRGNQAYVALALPATYFAEADDNHDGLLSPAEIAAHADLLQRLVATTLHLSDGDTPAILRWVSVTIEPNDTARVVGPSDFVLVLVVGQFPQVPRTISLRLDRLNHVGGGGADRLFVRATRDGVTEAATFRAGHASHTFYGATWSRAADGVRLGLEHILTGADHLLFLLTLVLAGIGWRYWVGVISSFTVGHSLVLAVTALGFVAPVKPALTEVLIAATIVFMASRALLGRRAEHIGREAALAGVCGLVHGLGVASAVRALDMNGRPDLLTLGTFNVGVEIGQLAVAVACVLMLRLLAKRERANLVVPRLLASSAGVAGLVWIVARLPAAL